ncbi:MAG: sugar kinase [Propionibacterium sp.]|nr:sugar kinase [Propionibacterium sp.]
MSGLFVGLTTLDVVQLVDRMPAPDEKIRGLDDMLAAGGPATNAAVAFAREAATTTLVTRVPDGPAWDLIRGDLATCGVSVRRAATQPGRRVTVASIMVTRATGDRAVISTGDRSHVDTPPPDDDLGEIDVRDYDVVLIDGHEADLARTVVERAREAGVPVVLDGGSWKPATPDLLPHVDAAVVSSAFAPDGVAAPAAVLDFLLEAGPRFAAVTRGGSSVLYKTRQGAGEVRPPSVDVVDTLGAGDFFHGGFAAHVARHGLTEVTLVDALAHGARVAASSIGSFGTRAWLGQRP